jgi:RNA polymerase sigma-70 factor, ECF subfamily
MIGPLFPELLAAAQGGDEQAFAVLWRDLQPAVLRYFRVAAGEAAEDLAADTWVSVIRSLGRFLGVHRGPPPGHRLAPAGRASPTQAGPG